MNNQNIIPVLLQYVLGQLAENGIKVSNIKEARINNGSVYIDMINGECLLLSLEVE